MSDHLPTRWVRVRDGTETVGMTRYTDTYLLEGGKWLCVLTQVAPDCYPPDSTIVVRHLEGKLQP